MIDCKNEYIETKTSKLENCFKMLELLKKNDKMKANELVKQLGIRSKRMINYYKTTLIYLGYNIVSYGGYDGGFKYIPHENLTDQELKIIENALGTQNCELIIKIKKINERVK
jgi:predicted DNA-binding transcriptional regulator YafY